MKLKKKWGRVAEYHFFFFVKPTVLKNQKPLTKKDDLKAAYILVEHLFMILASAFHDFSLEKQNVRSELYYFK